MIRITKYLTLCAILVSSQNIRATDIGQDCDYVLCRLKKGHSENNGYYAAEGSAISSQIVMPDGSLVTNSKGKSVTSDGIHSTFHQLRREADKFVSKTSSDDSSSINSQWHRLPSITGFPFQQPNTFYSSESQRATEQKKYSQSPAGGDTPIVWTKFQQVGPQISQVASITKEQQEVNKKIIQTKNTAVYPNSDSEIEIEQQSGANSGANVNTFVYGQNVPNGYKFNQQQDGEFIQVPEINPVVQTIPVAISGKSSSSYQQVESSSQTNTSHIQPNFITKMKPGTFTAQVFELDNTNKDLHEYISQSIPQVVVTKPNKESHYETEENTSSMQKKNTFANPDQKEYRFKAIPFRSYKGGFPSDDINQIKTDEYDDSKQMRVEQYENSKNSASSQTNIDGLPTTRLIFKVKVPESASASQTYHKESSSSHSRSVSSNGQMASDASQSGGVASQQFDQYGGFRSPILLGGIPQNVPLEKQMSTSSGSDYYEGTSSDGANANIPILVHGIPQTVRITKNKSSSSGSTQYYSSNGQLINEPLVPNSDYVVGQGDSNFMQSGSGSTLFQKLENVNGNSNAELCTTCVDSLSGFSSSNVPVRSSYGISTSFSSSSSNINGKKSENRQASVAVNDNGKIDTYNVHS